MQTTAMFGLLSGAQTFYTTKMSQLVIRDKYQLFDSQSSASDSETLSGD